jgi:K+-sensing histidine kinase KdpD
VLINLLSNAIKYNPSETPRITIDWRLDRGAVQIDVSDNGGGVTRGEAEDIFSKFTRGNRAVEGQGAGLGLPISRAIMQRMGGDLTVVFRQDGTSFFRATLRRAGLRPAQPPRAAE